MFSEIAVTIKDDEKRLTKKFPQYDIFTIDESDPIIKTCIDETLSNFDGKPESVQVKITLDMT